MMPDKIYIGTVTLSSNAPSEEHLLADWHLRPNPKIANVEYIRKDALVERINKQILFYQNSVSVNDYEEGCNKGAIAALEHVVKSL